jgi:hypothetical protein
MPTNVSTKIVRRNRSGRINKSKPKKVNDTIKRYVKRAIHSNIEDKQSIVFANSDSISSSYSAGLSYDLLANMGRSVSESIVSTGGLLPTGVNQGMLGLNVRARYLHIRGTILGPSPGIAGPFVPVTSFGRILVVLDEQATNGTPLVLYNGVSFGNQNILEYPQIYSKLMLTGGKRRFRVLLDKKYMVNTYKSNCQVFDYKINLNNMKIDYYPTTSSYYELTKRIKLFIIGTNDNTAFVGPATLQFQSTFVFEDA